MKRLEEKVKDIVEVRASPGLTDFLANPAETLNGYHFTDITADLMAKWIGKIADIRKGRGAAFALAGFRGVGKSHFLAALSAIVSQPELRTKIADSHVMSTAQRLSRRHGVVVHLKRGSSDSLLLELKLAVAEVTGTRSGEFSDSLNEILMAAADKSGDIPLVLLIDTALGRETRVTRDDGALLSDIASSAITQGIFVGIALDDDIAGADGMNSSIANSFTIDYLDQEHLYKIVDAHVFPKHDQMRPILHDIYESYRAAMPGFRWSEHRFSSLYPMHPAILETAPFVRLYLHDFALLGFAVDAGLKILGRPANSLIGLDEVFDSVETRLRNVSDLKDAFVAYDALDRDVIAKAPVMKRHEAKLILKGLFILSFNGEGVTATELAAAMLIFNEAQPTAGTASVEAILQSFAKDAPNAVKQSESSDRETRYGFKIDGGENLNSRLAELIKKVPADAVELILRRLTAEKFSDFDISDDGSIIWATCHAVWRGGIRRGEVIWLSEGATPDASEESGNWKVFIRYGVSSEAKDDAFSWPAAAWKLGALTGGDLDTIRRFHVLQTDNEIRETFKDSISTTLHVHSIAVEKIWQRIFLDDSSLISGEKEYKFTEQAKSSYNLAQLFTGMLEEQLEKHFPAHPHFSQVIGSQEVSSLVEHLFSGSGSNNPEIQKLAANFALPLGLVYENDGVLVPCAAGELVASSIVKEVIDLTELDQKDVIPLNEVATRMQAAPYGLTSETQQLVLAALVAQRQFEFVTSSENRINHRSLDLQIIWEDIVGIARPSGDVYSGDRLLMWASLLTADSSLNTLKPTEARLKVIDILSDWLKEWRKDNIVVQFDALPDEKLNSKLWRTASSVKKTFGSIAETVDGLLKENVTLDKCLQTIADVFADSEDEFESRQKDLTKLRQFIVRSTERDEINKYLALCEQTNDPGIEDLRSTLMETIVNGYFDHQDDADNELRHQWLRFKTLYSEVYAAKHDSAMLKGQDSRKLNEFFRTDLWTTFAALSELPWFGRHDMELAMAKIRELRIAQCDADVRKTLEVRPFCECSFRLNNATDTDGRINDLGHTASQGMDYFRHKLLAEQSAHFLRLGEMDKQNQSGDAFSKVQDLVPALENTKDFPTLTASQVHILKNVTRDLDTSSPLHSDRRRVRVETFEGIHLDDLRELEDELDSLAELSKLNV
ncbi:MAG: DUF6079 family protein [Pyrinomonadaceae bacterium]